MALVHQRGWDSAVFEESPWFAWLEPALDAFRHADTFPDPERFSALHAACAEPAGVPPLRFAPAPPKKPRRRARREPVVLAELYEGRIMERGEVPTRVADWHDFFNALAFLTFPRAKAALHARQYRLLKGRLTPTARRLPGARTREQDALSLFDEGGIAVALEPAQATALPSDPDAFEVALLDALARGVARAVPFGHALFEHLVAGLPDMLGTVCVVPVVHAGLTRTQLLAALDACLGCMLADPFQFQEPSRARGFALQRLFP